MVSKTSICRRNLRCHVTHLLDLIKESKGILEAPIPTDPQEILDNRGATKCCIDTIAAKISDIKEEHHTYNQKFSEIVDDDEMEREEKDYQELVEGPGGYLSLLNTANRTLSSLETRFSQLASHAITPSSSPSAASVHTGRSSDTSASTVRLPKIPLPTFEGDILRFREFWSMFDSAVHSKPDLSKVVKLTYLIPQLKGDAAEIVRGYLHTEENYDIIVSRLQERYNRTDDRLISMLHAELKKIPRASGAVKEKRKVMDSCERVFRQLEQMGQSLDPGISLVFDLFQKFPNGMIKEMERRYNVGQYSSLSTVRKTIETLIGTEELTQGFLQDLNSVGNNTQSKPHGQERDSTFSSQGRHPFDNRGRGRGFAAGRGSGPGSAAQRRSPCYFCGQSHGNECCQQYPTAVGRMVRLREMNRCPRCMQSRHDNTLCPVSISCAHCQSRNSHASALCFRQYPDNSSGNLNWQSGYRRGGIRGSGTGGPPNRGPLVHFTNDQNGGIRGSGTGGPPSRGPLVHFTNDQNGGIRGSGTGGPPSRGPAHDQSGSRDAGRTGTGNGSGGPQRAQDFSQSAFDIANFSGACSKNSLFQTAIVTGVNFQTGQRYRLRLVVDTLSNRTYITEQAASWLGLFAQSKERLWVSVFGSKKNIEISSNVVTFGLERKDGRSLRITANTTRLISNSPFLPQTWPRDAPVILQHHIGRLADNPFDTDKTVDILLGADYAWDVIAGPKVPIGRSSIFLVPSVFGYMLGGQLFYGSANHRSEFTMLCLTESNAQFPSELSYAAFESKCPQAVPDIDEFWCLERIGISDDPVEDDDAKATECFTKSVEYKDGRYHVGWPWIEENKKLLKTNRDMAFRRFQSLTNRLRSDPELLKTYRSTIRDQSERGFIETVPPEEMNVPHATHYLPHHPVFKPSSATTKLRIVYDASAKQFKHDVSLNECLLRGPVILPDLCHMLIRFRTNETVVMSDIEKAYLHIALHVPDRDVTRFFWYVDEENPSTDAENICIKRFARVPFGIVSSAFLLAIAILHHLENEGSEFAKSLARDIYVDNVISAIPKGESVTEYFHRARAIFAKAGMNLREFCSNSQEFMDSIPQASRVKERDTRVLGMRWDSAGDDTLRIVRSPKWDQNRGTMTKRGILRSVASIFDPLGFFQPVLFSAKLLLRDVWTGGKSWDSDLSSSLVSEWSTIQRSLDQIYDQRIPRFIGEVQADSSIVVFGDASKNGYGTAVYIRTPSANGKFATHLTFSKSRLAPISKKGSQKNKMTVTLPRLELLGASVSASAAEFCRKALSDSSIPIHLFSDSECVLHWLNSRKELKRFVNRRVMAIHSVRGCSFHYVATDDNPADALTRGKTTAELVNDELWWHGPSWLCLPETEWPETNLPEMSSDVLRELKDKLNPEPTFVASEDMRGPIDIDFSRFSSLPKLIRVTWYCLKFIKLKVFDKLPDLTKNRFRLQATFAQIDDRQITDEGYQAVLRLLVKSVQMVAFQDEISAVKRQERPPLVNQLNLQLDAQGLLRACSRYSNADLPETARCPAILPKNHILSELVVKDVHESNKHVGPSQTLSELRRQYWIPQGRAFVRKVLKKCLRCHIFRSVPTFRLPEMPPWPKERVSQSAPFQFVGVDYFGPMKVKIGGGTGKMWACLFACLSTRAIHLEPVLDCTSAEFFNALVRFISRRECPQQIISDNAAQFHLSRILADKAWKEVPDDPDIVSHLARNGIKWTFIVELAPWQGGHYERLVGVVKSTLKTIVGRRLLSWSDLVTLLVETEAIANSRPITYVNSEPDDGFMILRPVDFLLFRPSSSPPIASTDFPIHDLGDSGRRLASIWKQRERYIQKLWNLWYEHYLLSLRERSNMFHRSRRNRVDRVPYVGEVVIIKDDNLPRGSWRLGRVSKLIVSKDKKIRAAEIKLASGMTLNRAVNFLIPLEISAPEHSDGSSHEIGSGDADQSGDNDQFFGFSQDDILRTVQMIDLFDDISDSE